MTSKLKVMLAAAALLAAVSTAQASVLSDNLAALPEPIGETVSGNRWVTASFGTDGQGYELTSVVLRMELMAGSPGAAQVDIYTSVSSGPGQPGLLVGTLTTPGSFTSPEVTFTASGIVLSPNSTYWVVLKSKLSGNDFVWYWTNDDSGGGVGFQHTWGHSEDAGLSWATFATQPQIMQVNAEPVSPWTNLGSSLPGVSGAPLLEATGTMEAGSQNVLDLSNAAPSAVAILFAAPSSLPTPFMGGIVLPDPIYPPTFGMTDAAGAIKFRFILPAGMPSGSQAWIQWGIEDAAAVKGVSLSNAVEGVTP